MIQQNRLLARLLDPALLVAATAGPTPRFPLEWVADMQADRGLWRLLHPSQRHSVPGASTVAAHTIQLDELSESLWRVLRNDQAAEKVGITERQAAILLLMTYDRVAKDLTREPVDLADLPARMKQLCAISTE